MKRRVFLQGTLATGAAGLTSIGLLAPQLSFAEDVKPADPAKAEPAKTEEPKADTAKTEPAKTEAAKTETAAAKPAEASASPFTATSYDDALKALNITLEASDKVAIKAPEIAENGAVVPVTISTTLEGATQLGLLVKNNPTPLAAIFTISEGTEANTTTRIKMAKTSEVIAFVKVGDKTYSAKQEVKVTLGGCGG